jgi:hypothetical protein
LDLFKRFVKIIHLTKAGILKKYTHICP